MLIRFGKIAFKFGRHFIHTHSCLPRSQRHNQLYGYKFATEIYGDRIANHRRVLMYKFIRVSA